MSACRHCGEDVPAELTGSPWCCAGCEAAATFVAELGLEDFYRLRTVPAARPHADATPAHDFDSPALRAAHVRRTDDGDEALLELDGIRCAACAWLLERALRAQPGVRDVAVNAATARVLVCVAAGTPLAPLATVVPFA